MLDCSACGFVAPIVRGVPVLINDANSVFAAADYVTDAQYTGASYGSPSDKTGGLRGFYRRMTYAMAEFAIGGAEEQDADTALTRFCEAAPTRPRVLVIGAGDTRYTQPADVVYTDVAHAPHLAAIADGHDLPFADQSFDFVLAIAVLEHVADPPRVVSEIWRVLRAEGQVYAATPFLQPVHMGAYDFTRFTYLGHRRLFRWFAEINSGMALGPGAVAAWSVKSVCASMARSRRGRQIASLIGLVLGLPLKFLDYRARHSPSAIDSAGGVFFHGRKQDRPISDREMIGLYRGGF